MISDSLPEYRVLIAEDHPIEQKLLLAVLGPAGYTMKLAGNGERALSYLEAEDFDLIVMDSHMPILSGIEAIRAIRGRIDWKRSNPILLMIEDMGISQQTEALAKADVCVTKPLDIALFLSAAARLARAGRTLRHSSTGGGAILKSPGSGKKDHRLLLGRTDQAGDQEAILKGTPGSSSICLGPLSQYRAIR
jgi:CheY-like chemotaxis protein